MVAPALQQELFTSSGDFVASVHSQGKHCRIYLAQRQDPETWWQRGYSFEQAVNYANDLGSIEARDCYLSAHGFSWEPHPKHGRTLSHVESLNLLFVDLDYYKVPRLANLKPGELVELICKENPWLPTPTHIVDSGNGCWMFWVFARSLNTKSKNDWLSQWQSHQVMLVSLLADYGADPRCSDAARVVRLAGTVNSKTDRAAMAWSTGQCHKFPDLKRAIANEYSKRTERPQSPQKAAPVRQEKRQGPKVATLFTWFNLAYRRMQDYKKLAVLRGGRYIDCRKQVIWFYAVEAAHYCKSEDTLRAEVESFIRGYIHQPDRYLKVNIDSTIKRFNDELALGPMRSKAREQLGPQGATYILKHQTIVERLGITPDEQRQLKVLIGPGVKARRKTEKRRERGIKPRGEYEDRAEQRRVKAVELYRELHSIRKVAKVMGVSPGIVHRAIDAHLKSLALS